MPQGGIDAGESPEQAALRELREETGVPEDAVQFLGALDDWLYYDLPEDLAKRLSGGGDTRASGRSGSPSCWWLATMSSTSRPKCPSFAPGSGSN